MKGKYQITKATEIISRIDVNSISETIEKIENEIQKIKEVHNSKFRVIISGEPSPNVRIKVCEYYALYGGYKDVKHKTSSENDERSGLTSFEFFL